MWSRVVEAMLGCWLLMSPFLFRHAADETVLWVTDLVCGAAVFLLRPLSYWTPCLQAHFSTLAVVALLPSFAYLRGFGGAPAASQNHLILGLLLMMFAVIPNDAHRPSPEWRQPSTGGASGG